MSASRKRLGFFSRLLDEVSPAERYRLATEQIIHAEAVGLSSAWVAQHHFNYAEGGLPSPLVFLSHVAAQTQTIRLGTGIITLPLEQPLRVAEDAAVLDLLSGGRLDLGVGSGGTASSFEAFGQDSAQRGAVFEQHLAALKQALGGAPLPGTDRLYPPAHRLVDRIWQATFSVNGGARAGAAGDGLLLSRTQPRPADRPDASLADLQHPIIDAYLTALPIGLTPRIVASRTLFVADDRAEARHYAEAGLTRVAANFRKAGHQFSGDTLDDLIRALDTHVGTPEDVIASLSRDTTLSRVDEIVFQVHSVDPPHALILRSLELLASAVAPALGWTGDAPANTAPRLSLVR
ncbi:MAG: luciferase [Devosia sp.]|nr:luciferase [Devosia sp.]